MSSRPSVAAVVSRLRGARRPTTPEEQAKHELLTMLRARHPKFLEAVIADARLAARYRSERSEFRSTADALVQALRIACVSDSFLAQCAYRAKARCQALGIPVLPAICHRIAVSQGQLAIGDPVVIEAGIYIPHGQVVIDGFTDIHRAVTIAPFVSIGLVDLAHRGPIVMARASIGTGARVLGPVVIGEDAKVGANSVVIHDVPAGATAVGSPARVVRQAETA
jgi:serine O-acetyltransferase